MEAATRATPGTAHPPPHHPPAGPVGEPTRTASSAPQRHHPAHPSPTQAHPSTNPTPAPPMAPAPYLPTPAPPTADVVAPAGGTPSGVDGVCGTGCAGVTGTPPAALAAPAAKLRPNSPPTADDIARAEACCTAAGFAALPAEPASPLAELLRRITPTQQPRQRPHPATGRTTQRRTTPTTRRRQRRHLRHTTGRIGSGAARLPAASSAARTEGPAGVPSSPAWPVQFPRPDRPVRHRPGHESGMMPSPILRAVVLRRPLAAALCLALDRHLGRVARV